MNDYRNSPERKALVKELQHAVGNTNVADWNEFEVYLDAFSLGLYEGALGQRVKRLQDALAQYDQDHGITHE